MLIHNLHLPQLATHLTTTPHSSNHSTTPMPPLGGENSVTNNPVHNISHNVPSKSTNNNCLCEYLYRRGTSVTSSSDMEDVYVCSEFAHKHWEREDVMNIWAVWVITCLCNSCSRSSKCGLSMFDTYNVPPSILTLHLHSWSMHARSLSQSLSYPTDWLRCTTNPQTFRSVTPGQQHSKPTRYSVVWSATWVSTT